MVLLGKPEQVIGFREGQRAQQHRIDQAEDHRRRSDAYRQRQNDCEGERGISTKLTEGKAEIHRNRVLQMRRVHFVCQTHCKVNRCCHEVAVIQRYERAFGFQKTRPKMDTVVFRLESQPLRWDLKSQVLPGFDEQLQHDDKEHDSEAETQTGAF